MSLYSLFGRTPSERRREAEDRYMKRFVREQLDDIETELDSVIALIEEARFDSDLWERYHPAIKRLNTLMYMREHARQDLIDYTAAVR